MLIGVPTEIKTNENRVALVPAGVETFTARGHDVVVQAGAGVGSGFTDSDYTDAGAEIVDTSDEVWARAEMIMKVKEPIEPEWSKIREDQVLFTYFHFAASEPLTQGVARLGSGLDRVRDGATPVGRTPPAHAHERGGRSHGRAGGSQVSREVLRR